MMHVLNLTIGPNAVTTCEQLDEKRMSRKARRGCLRHQTKVKFNDGGIKQHCKMKRKVYSMTQKWLISGKIQKKLYDIK